MCVNVCVCVCYMCCGCACVYLRVSECNTACEVFESNLIVCIDGLYSVAQGKMASYNAIDNIVSLSDFISKFHFLFLLNTQQTHKTELITVNKG